MAEVDISKIILPDGTTYNLKAGVKGVGEVDISKIVLPDGTICNIKGSGSEIFAHLYVSVDSGAVVTATSTEATYTATAGSGDEAFIEIGKAGVYTITATKDGCASSSTTVNILEYGGIYNESVDFIKLTIDIPNGSDYAVTDGVTTFDGTSAGDEITYYLPNIGTWTVSCTDGTYTVSETVNVTEYTAYYVSLEYGGIYGVSWDKSSSTKLTRTDLAVGFTDPDPYVADGQHPGSSPFDTIMPWAGMVKETIDGNVLVKISKFWYKITNTSNELKFQIANYPADGFKVSPAHADRGDGKGERDFVYIARYKCSSTDYKSQTGKSPKVSITRAEARTAISGLGTGYWQQDFAMFWTVRMLYLVEYANWNSQATIGYGCGNGSSVQNTGASDSMTYHTGTMQSARTTYGVGVQYRWIEDLWGNAHEWCDGIYFSGSNVYCINNPANFSDTTGGTNTGTRPTTIGGYISDWSIPTATGFEYALYPSAVSGGEQTYIADICGYNSSGVTLYVGCSYSRGQQYGMFFLYGYYTASMSSSILGSRLQKLP